MLRNLASKKSLSKLGDKVWYEYRCKIILTSLPYTDEKPGPRMKALRRSVRAAEGARLESVYT